MTTTALIPKAFVERRLHSLMGLWLVVFLIQHLLTNSQAALWFNEDGRGFIDSVNKIHDLPYLRAIEIFLLGLPFALHIIWGIKYLHTSKMNSFKSDGSAPSLPEYPRNRAYTWQRITSWILLIGVIAHVMHMRIYHYPASAKLGHEDYYMVRVFEDEGLYTLAARLNVALYDSNTIRLQELEWEPETATAEFEEQPPIRQLQIQESRQKDSFMKALRQRPLSPGEVIAVAPDFGTAELLVVRNTFKIPIMLILYTLFVWAAVFHAFNGLWTFLITWGVNLTARSQDAMRTASLFLMGLIGFLGMAAIWGTYFITLNA